MPTLPVRADFSAGVPSVAQFNDIKHDIEAVLGKDTTPGTIDNTGIATGADIDPAKLLGTAAVRSGSGQQAIVKETMFSLPRLDASSGNTFAMANGATPAIDRTKLFQKTGGVTTITGLTGGLEGDEIMVYKAHAVQITHGTVDAANTIHLKSGANDAAGAFGAANPKFIHLLCSKFGADFASLQWFEI